MNVSPQLSNCVGKETKAQFLVQCHIPSYGIEQCKTYEKNIFFWQFLGDYQHIILYRVDLTLHVLSYP